MKTIEEEINENGKLVFTNVGTSMKPLIKQDRDILIIEKTNGKLKKYDIPLYKRKDGQYVLHRILNVSNDEYVICGDNCYIKEYGITDSNIIGVLTAIVRKGKQVKTTDFKYKLYTHIWCDLFFIRAFMLRMFKFLKRMINK